MTDGPRLSIVLLDWSCRESFHILDHLARQSVPRELFEILWVEYYDRRAPELAGRVDQHLVLGLPKELYYHKHLMYNAGIVRARGDIVAICDSDAMVKADFVESILDVFRSQKDVVLHLDQVRNGDRSLYPYCSPSFERVEGAGALNWRDGKTTGLRDPHDPLHTRNYGACFCARREDLIAIGGADEHIDYLGHICGPYEMTFRLINAGKREVWHDSKFLYHTWHPGTDGEDNYLGPHDGRNVSTTALAAIRSGRVPPLEENAAIRALREGARLSVPVEELIIPTRELRKWRRRALPAVERRAPRDLRMLILAARATARQVIQKGVRRLAPTVAHAGKPSPTKSVMNRSLFDRITLVFKFVGRAWKNNLYGIEACRQIAERLERDGCGDAAVYGAGELAETLFLVLANSKVRLAGRFDARNVGSIGRYSGKVVVAELTGIDEACAALVAAGVEPSKIVRMQ